MECWPTKGANSPEPTYDTFYGLVPAALRPLTRVSTFMFRQLVTKSLTASATSCRLRVTFSVVALSRAWVSEPVGEGQGSAADAQALRQYKHFNR